MQRRIAYCQDARDQIKESAIWELGIVLGSLYRWELFLYQDK
jgi:hypothetical protein